MTGFVRTLVLISLVALGACNNGIGEVSTDTDRTPVRVITAQERAAPRVLRFSGTVEANREVKAVSRSEGKYAPWPLKKGSSSGKAPCWPNSIPPNSSSKNARQRSRKTKPGAIWDRMEKLHRKGTVPLSSFQDGHIRPCKR